MHQSRTTTKSFAVVTLLVISLCSGAFVLSSCSVSEYPMLSFSSAIEQVSAETYTSGATTHFDYIYKITISPQELAGNDDIQGYKMIYEWSTIDSSSVDISKLGGTYAVTTGDMQVGYLETLTDSKYSNIQYLHVAVAVDSSTTVNSLISITGLLTVTCSQFAHSMMSTGTDNFIYYVPFNCTFTAVH
jgi:hypothetical protein